MRRRTAAGATGLASAEVDAVRRHWCGLTLEEKIAVLHFQDRALVEKLHAIQQMLRYSELMCYVCGVSTRDAVRKNVPYGLDSFEFECQGISGGGMGLLGFKATQKFAESEDMLEHIEQQLGGFLADSSRAALWQTPSDWVQLFDPSPNSWSEFLSQVLRLVELALLRAYRLAANSSDRAHDQMLTGSSEALPLLSLTSEAALDLELAEAQVVSAGSRGAKRKARKKRMEAKQPGREGDLEVEDEAAVSVVEDCLAAEADEADEAQVDTISEQEAEEMPNVDRMDTSAEAEAPAVGAGLEVEPCSDAGIGEIAVEPTDSHGLFEDMDSWQVVSRKVLSRRKGRVASKLVGAAERQPVQARSIAIAPPVASQPPARLGTCSQKQNSAPVVEPAGMEMLRGRDKQATPPLSGSRASSVTATTADDPAWAPQSPSCISGRTRPTASSMQSSTSAASSDAAGSSEELRSLDEMTRRGHASGKVEELPTLLRPVSSPQAAHRNMELMVPSSGTWYQGRFVAPRSTDVIVRAPNERSSDVWSAWVNNGSTGQDSAWQLVTLEPSDVTVESDGAASPVPVQVVATELRVEVRRTFLEINLYQMAEGKARDRARSAGP